MPATVRSRLSTFALLAALSAVPACDKKHTIPVDQLPAPLQPEDLQNGRGKQGDLTAVVDDFEYRYHDKERNRSTLLRAARSEPGSQGTQVLTRPRATIMLAPNRMMVLSAAKAQFTVPGNQPRDGLFTGSDKDPVVLTLYQCEPGQAPDLKNPKDVRLKVYFDEAARFDLERDEVRSDGPVQLTGPNMDFRGSGLQLTWNRLEQRMEQLDIAHGQVLRYRSAENARPQPQPSAGTAPAAGPKTAGAQAAGPATATTAPAPAAAPQAAPVTRYRTVLSGAVRGHLNAPEPADEIRLQGASMEAFFAMDAAEPDKADIRPPAGPHAALFEALAGAAFAGPAVPTRSAEEKRQDARSLFQPGPRDLTLHWNGPLQLRPAAEAQPGEDLLTLTGDQTAPASVKTGRGHLISGQTLTYARGSGRVAARGAQSAPVLLASPDGLLTGTRMDLDPGTGKAYVFGPGRMEGRTDTRKNAKPTDTKTEPLRVTYTDHVEADFTTTAVKTGQTPRLGDPVETRLYGQVQASHPDFRLGCGKLSIGFEKSADHPGRTTPSRIDATQDATLLLRDAKKGDVTVKSPAVRLTLENAHGKVAPNQMAAAGPVEVTQGDGAKLTCNRLDVGFTHPAKAADKPTVAVITATGEARYNGLANGKQAQLAADTLTVDALKNTLALTGSQEHPAAIDSDGLRLSGPQVDLEKGSGVAKVNGPGRLTVVTQSKTDGGKTQTPGHLAVSWQGRMGWNDAKGRGYFEKQVDCAADSAEGASTLHADDSLELRVDPAPAKEARTPPETKRETKRDIRLADARGKVVFTGEQNNDQGNLVGRVRIDGPNLLLKNDATAANPAGEQTLAVAGAGLMQVENFQHKADADQQAAALDGSGVTFFSWKKHMLMDMAKNDLHLLHNVRIIHRPLLANNQYAPMDEAISLDCQETRADLTENGGFGMLGGAKTGTPTKKGAVEMRQLHCDYGVVLTQKGESIKADHLLYTRAKHAAELWCDGQRLVELQAKGQNAPATADRVVWRTDLRRLDVTHPAGGMLPQWK